MPKTSELPAKLAPTGTEEIPVNDGGTSRKIAASALLDRARHIGTQLAATISDFAAAVDARITAAGLATQAALNGHTSNVTNPHAVTKAQVGLGLVPDVDATARTSHTGTQSADTLTDGATNVAMLATERTKLAGVMTGATANSPDATLINRANHTGTQLAATISDFDAQVRTSRLDQLAAPTLSVALNAQRITAVADPAAAQDAATKNYVDGHLSLDDQIRNALSTTGQTHDFKIVGTGADAGYIVLGHFRMLAVAGWTAPLNAVHTVAAGKTLVVIEARPSYALVVDSGSRQARLRNTTDAVDVLPGGSGVMAVAANYAYLETNALNGFAQVAAGKTVSLDLWDIDAIARGMGMVLICKEI